MQANLVVSERRLIMPPARGGLALPVRFRKRQHRLNQGSIVVEDDEGSSIEANAFRWRAAGGGGGGAVIDAVTASQFADQTVLSFSHVPVGVPTGIVIAISFFVEDQDITVITYGGNAMTLEVSTRTQAFGNRTSIYSLANPPSGTQTVAITFLGSNGGGYAVYSITGGSTSDVITATNTATGTSTAPSVAVSSATDAVVIDSVTNEGGSNLTVGASQIERLNVAYGGGRHASSTEGGAASVTMSWTAASSTAWATAVASIRAA